MSASNTKQMYRSILRAIPPSSPSRPFLRSLVATSPPTFLRSMGVYLQNERLHEELMLRYHPIFSLTEEERIKKTANRVGLNVPKEFVPQEYVEEAEGVKGTSA